MQGCERQACEWQPSISARAATRARTPHGYRRACCPQRRPQWGAHAVAIAATPAGISRGFTRRLAVPVCTAARAGRAAAARAGAAAAARVAAARTGGALRNVAAAAGLLVARRRGGATHGAVLQRHPVPYGRSRFCRGACRPGVGKAAGRASF